MEPILCTATALTYQPVIHNGYTDIAASARKYGRFIIPLYDPILGWGNIENRYILGSIFRNIQLIFSLSQHAFVQCNIDTVGQNGGRNYRLLKWDLYAEAIETETFVSDILLT